VLWRDQAFEVGDAPVGGASAGNFALVWTQQKAYAYNSATGQWQGQPLAYPPLGGIAKDGFGIVWNPRSIYAFDTNAATWVPVDLGLVDGISAAGSGKVGLVWGGSRAQAYSGFLDSWFPLITEGGIMGGSAGGEAGLIWDYYYAYGFDANTGIWIHTALPSGGAGIDSGPQSSDGFRIGPNPVVDGSLRFDLPAAGTWKVSIVDPSGARVRALESGPAAGGRLSGWDGLDEKGRSVPSGSYWVRAELEDRVEVRRVVWVR
jgi:hypothetical protein